MFEAHARSNREFPAEQAAGRAPSARFDDVFSLLSVPRRDLTAAVAEPAPATALQREEPTRSGVFRWLTAGLAVAGATAIAVNTSVLAIGMTLLKYSGSKWCLGAAIAAPSISIALRAWQVAVQSRERESFADLYFGESKRVRQEADRAATARGIEPPEIRQLKGIKNLGMLDRPGRTNLLVFNPRSTSELSDRELRGAVAHEIEHADRWFSGYRWGAGWLQAAATASITWAAGHSIWTTMCESGFVANLLPFGAAFAGMLATSFVTTTALSLIGNIATRANELRTDIRAVERTRDLEAYRSGFEKLYALLTEQTSSWIAKFQPIASHPPHEKRMRWIEMACGEKPSIQTLTGFD